ncbi:MULTISPECIES: FHA domain-containing protein [unclassified Curtobacterium]|uniref:FHA domain-containing protein n=1 Tax=unclassified Curtobacterium TaxID=257496 RepID=UPI000DA7E9F7|nr:MULTISPECIES: FHA domain-containing protein [unclassified Curtobacterium]WIB62342.1 FHA domain-containing protein [Curtobacterium sp. MCBD17_040]WIB66172.1 FHA domain-containing protein [Curtobacterium sp. MCBD17_035]
MGEDDDTILGRPVTRPSPPHPHVRHARDDGGPARPTAGSTTTGSPHPGTDGVESGRVPAIRVGEQVVRLDRPVVIGRRPAPPRVPLTARPLLVTVPSRHGEVSGSHLAVRAEGTAVVVEDLASTNGTVVRAPGARPFRMPSGAAIVVLTGTVVDIGDGNTVEILSRHLRIPEATRGGLAGDPLDLPPIPRHHD